jgi:hypothetical protein
MNLPSTVPAEVLARWFAEMNRSAAFMKGSGQERGRRSSRIIITNGENKYRMIDVAENKAS